MKLTFNAEDKSCDKPLEQKFITILAEIFQNKIDKIRQQESIIVSVCTENEIENIKAFFSCRVKSIQNVYNAVLQAKDNLKSLEEVSLEDFDFAIDAIHEKREEYEKLMVELNYMKEQGHDMSSIIRNIEDLEFENVKAEIAISDYYNGCVIVHRN